MVLVVVAIVFLPLLLIVFDGTPRTRIDITAVVGALDGEASSKGLEGGVREGGKGWRGRGRRGD